MELNLETLPLGFEEVSFTTAFSYKESTGQRIDRGAHYRSGQNHL